MPWTELSGQDRAVNLVRRALAKGELHHAYLVTGPDGVGKELLCRLVAQGANCEAHASDPCGACLACTQIARGVFSDVFWVRPQAELVKKGLLNKGDLEGAPSREIRVDEVRGLARRLSLSLVRGRRKIAVISPADALNERAQNALLKTLEEPPPQTTFLLVTSAPDTLLPTVRSRCARLPLGPLPDELVARLLERSGLPAAEARERAAIAHGSLALAQSLSGDQLAWRKAMLAQARAANGSPDERAALELAEELSDREPALALVSVLAEELHDQLVAQALAPAVPALPALFLRQLEVLEVVRAALEQNGNPRLQLERALLSMRELNAAVTPRG